MKTALRAAALGAAIALVLAIKPAPAAGSAFAETGGGGYPLNQLSDDACDGDSKCDKGKQTEASAENKNADGDGAEPDANNVRPADAETTGKPVPEDSPPAAGSGVAIAKSDDDDGKGKKADQKDEDEEEEEDDEWDDGPYEDPLGFDDE